MYPEDFYLIQQNNESHTEFGFPLLEILISFSKATNLHDLKHKARKLRDKFKRIHQNGGLTGGQCITHVLNVQITNFSTSSLNLKDQFCHHWIWSKCAFLVQHKQWGIWNRKRWALCKNVGWSTRKGTNVRYFLRECSTNCWTTHLLGCSAFQRFKALPMPGC